MPGSEPSAAAQKGQSLQSLRREEASLVKGMEESWTSHQNQQHPQKRRESGVAASGGGNSVCFSPLALAVVGSMLAVLGVAFVVVLLKLARKGSSARGTSGYLSQSVYSS